QLRRGGAKDEAAELIAPPVRLLRETDGHRGTRGRTCGEDDRRPRPGRTPDRPVAAGRSVCSSSTRTAPPNAVQREGIYVIGSDVTPMGEASSKDLPGSRRGPNS